MQDPFGNYVLQYIVDLAEPIFTNPLCYSFQSSIPALSKQKFSSNVIEKCLRGAEPEITSMMVEEMLNANELEKMLRDSFANYVVQTALDYSPPETKAKLIEAIRPILPAIRQTPYGRRIQSKITGGETQDRLSGLSTPNDVASPGQIPLGRHPANAPGSYTLNQPARTNANYQHTTPIFNPSGAMVPPQYSVMPASATSGHGHRLSNSSNHYSPFNTVPNQNPVHQPIPLYGRGPQANGFNYF